MENAADELESVYRAWQCFVENGDTPGSEVRPEIARSWARCRSLGIDPYASKAPMMLEPRRVAAVRQENRDFIEMALPFMEFLKTAVKGTGFILVLTDNSGVVLEAFGDSAILAMAREDNYVPGCSRAEEVAGTNSINLALIERKAIQLTGAEHWNVRNHCWTCASAPVFSPEGMLLGTVTLSGETTASHRHTLGMVISAAEAIQNRAREREIALKKQQADTLLWSVLESISDAIITVDALGVVSNVNRAAARMLDVKPDGARGKSILKLFPGYPELVRMLELGKECASFDVTSERPGAKTHFVLTPYLMQDQDGVQGAIIALRERREYLNEVRGISGLSAVFTFDEIIGESPALLHQIDLAKVAARQNSRILILGETGTGKELFAQAIHNASARRSGPFVALNCAAIPRELMESEMFGYRSGAFTGARKGGQVGKLELADGGTLFLDEVNQMPMDLQAKLLRALQEGMITRVGDSKPIRIDMRVIAAANEDLYAKSQSGEFRQDLYFRLSVVEISLPPLRERPGDIGLLAQQLLHKLARKLGKPGMKLSAAATERLCQYPWPGNVRELENVLEMAAIVCESGTIEASHVSRRMKTVTVAEPDRGAFALQTHSVRDAEIHLIRSAIQEFNGNVAEAARKLGLSRSTLYRRMQEHGIVKSITIE